MTCAGAPFPPFSTVSSGSGYPVDSRSREARNLPTSFSAGEPASTAIDVRPSIRKLPGRRSTLAGTGTRESTFSLPPDEYAAEPARRSNRTTGIRNGTAEGRVIAGNFRACLSSVNFRSRCSYPPPPAERSASPSLVQALNLPGARGRGGMGRAAGAPFICTTTVSTARD